MHTITTQHEFLFSYDDLEIDSFGTGLNKASDNIWYPLFQEQKLLRLHLCSEQKHKIKAKLTHFKQS